MHNTIVLSVSEHHEPEKFNNLTDEKNRSTEGIELQKYPTNFQKSFVNQETKSLLTRFTNHQP